MMVLTNISIFMCLLGQYEINPASSSFSYVLPVVNGAVTLCVRKRGVGRLKCRLI